MFTALKSIYKQRNWIHICGVDIENRMLPAKFSQSTEHCDPCGYKYVFNLRWYPHKYDFHYGYL
jgi:hypothetical protein